MWYNNKYIWWRIVAFCDGTEQEIHELRQALFNVCKQWRNEFKLHLWVYPTSAYCKALEAKNYHLANSIWDFSGDCIDCHCGPVVDAVFRHGQQLHAKRLIARDDFYPACYDNLTIRYASEYGYTDVVQLLLQDSRVDPAADDNLAIQWASKNGHADVVRLLLQDYRVDPSARNNVAIRCASKHGEDKVVQLLLQDPRVNPSADDNQAIRLASEYRHFDVVRLLLRDVRMHLSFEINNWCLRIASDFGHVDIVRLLQNHRQLN